MRLVCLSYCQQVRADELKRGHEDVKSLLADLSPGFRVLADLSQLEAMDLGCIKEIGRVMELLDRSGVEMVVRVIPEPGKDIGFNILTPFHYPHHRRIVNCKTMTEAAELLML